MPVASGPRDEFHDSLLQQVPQTAEPIHFPLVHTAHGQLARPAESHDARDVLRSGSEASLVASAMYQRGDLDSFSHVEGAHAFRPVHLVARQREEVDAQLLHIDRQLAERLNGVRVEKHVTLPGDPRQLGDGLNRTDLVVRHHHADQDGLRRDRPGQLLWVHEAIAIHLQIGYVEARLAKRITTGQHGRVLRPAGDDVIATLEPCESHSFDGQIVGLRTSAGENNTPGGTPERMGDDAASPLRRRPGLVAAAMDARGISKVRVQERPHRLNHIRMHRGGGVVVEVDSPFGLRRPPNVADDHRRLALSGRRVELRGLGPQLSVYPGDVTK